MEVYFEILFVCEILLFMGVLVEYPFTMNYDNVGATFLLDNTLVPQWTMHIDVHHHLIWDYFENGSEKTKMF